MAQRPRARRILCIAGRRHQHGRRWRLLHVDARRSPRRADRRRGSRSRLCATTSTRLARCTTIPRRTSCYVRASIDEICQAAETRSGQSAANCSHRQRRRCMRRGSSGPRRTWTKPFTWDGTACVCRPISRLRACSNSRRARKFALRSLRSDPESKRGKRFFRYGHADRSAACGRLFGSQSGTS